MHSHAFNKRQEEPVKLVLAGLGDGDTRGKLSKLDGFPHNWRLVEEVPAIPLNSVYLTADSPNVLDELENDKCYVLGGIVDRNRLQRAAIDRAEALSLPHARLPLEACVDFEGTKVLTVNHCFEILCGWREGGWGKSMVEHMPTRKSVVEKGRDVGIIDEDGNGKNSI